MTTETSVKFPSEAAKNDSDYESLHFNFKTVQINSLSTRVTE